MTVHFKAIVLLATWLISAAANVQAEPASAPPPQMVGLRVAVDSNGRVVSSTPVDANAPAGMNQVAQEFARKLVFSPARKDGKPAASETNLTLVVALEPVGEGRFQPKLMRAVNGPGVTRMGRLDSAGYQGRKGAGIVVVSVDLDAKGVPSITTQKTERIELSEPNKFTEARYLDAITASVRRTVFEPEKVDGVAVPTRVTLPYVFGPKMEKPEPGAAYVDRGAKPWSPDVLSMPVMTAVSSVPGIDLPKIDYKAPNLVSPAK